MCISISLSFGGLPLVSGMAERLHDFLIISKKFFIFATELKKTSTIMRKFNTTGTCYPQYHYMVDITDRLDDIEKRVAEGEYITITTLPNG